MAPRDRPEATKVAARDGFVRVRGAREHNLKDAAVAIPRDALVVFTGVSGSGKSSLAFGTIYAEAQRRYFESVAPYARRLIDQVGVPDVDEITGLPPAVALQQARGTPGARSSVGSVSQLSSLVRMMYSRAGTYPARQPMLYAEDFSPNTAQGACPNCHGLGRVFEVTEQTMVPDPSLSIRERAIASWPPAWHGQNLRDILVTLGYDVDRPWRDLPKKDRDWILFTEEQPTVPVYAGFTPAETRAALRSKMAPSYQGTFMSARKYVLHTFATTQSALMKKRVSRYMIGGPCPVCDGKRLKREALAVTFAGVDIGTLAQMSLARVAALLAPAAAGRFDEVSRDAPPPTRAEGRADTARRIAAGGSAHAAAPDVRRTPNLSEEKRLAAQRLAQDLCARIATLQDLGLGYLSMERSTPTLSPGELQRLRLATQIRSNLFGVVYVLDEPTAGLHPADGEALLDALAQLKAQGNSLFIVEHDLEVMRRADWLVDVGPDAGEKGGEVLYSGPPEGLRDVEASRTARYLFAEAAPCARPPREPSRWLELRGLTRNNLHDLDARFPLGLFTAVTGVSGSGKSSLVSQALVELVCAHLGHEPEHPEDDVDDAAPEVVLPTRGRLHAGAEAIRRLVRVDQKPIGRTPRSNLALEVMRRADWLVDVGPDAGEKGGEVLYSGPPEGLRDVEASRTARYLFAEAAPCARPPREPSRWLELRGLTRNNLHDLDARFPLGLFTAVTGVSGSGKSSLVSQALVELVCAHLGHEPEHPEDDVDDAAPEVVLPTRGRLHAGAEAIRRLVRVDQKPIGRTPRSNLATYTGLFDAVRKLYAATPAARKRRYDAGRFSFNVAKGRCETCEGEGFVSVELLFMPSVYAPCPTCHGARYNEDTLKITWHGRHIADVLAMTVDDAWAFFADEPAVRKPLALLRDIGLGYLRLGQPATELSGGEAQRIKLATELQRPQRGDTLYVLDEPSTGLHPSDVDRLMAQLQGLVEAGNTVVVVEHEMRLVAASDWVIDMGPGAGEEGGRIVVCGTPQQVARDRASRTAPYLRATLARG